MKKAYLIVLFVLLMTVSVVAFAEAVAPVTSPFQIDLTQIFLAIITLLGALITNKLVPWLKANKTEKDLRILRAATATAVYAAEQLYGAGKGKEKLQYVKAQLAKKGFTVDIDQIEAAVQELTLTQQDNLG